MGARGSGGETSFRDRASLLEGDSVGARAGVREGGRWTVAEGRLALEGGGLVGGEGRGRVEGGRGRDGVVAEEGGLLVCGLREEERLREVGLDSTQGARAAANQHCGNEVFGSGVRKRVNVRVLVAARGPACFTPEEQVVSREVHRL